MAEAATAIRIQTLLVEGSTSTAYQLPAPNHYHAPLFHRMSTPQTGSSISDTSTF